MRIFFLSAVAVMVMGCGGKVADASADETTLPADAATCAFGEIGRMPGVPFGVASTGTSVFVVAAPVIGNAATNTEGTLYSVRGGGAEPINQSSGTNLVAFGDQVAYLRLETTAAGDLYASHLQSTDDNGSLAQIDIVNSDYVDMSSIAFDGKNKLAWYRWPTLLSAGQPRALPSIASTSAPGQAITTSTIDPDVLGVGAFVTDGQHYYAAFDTKEDGLVIGVLPVNADPKLVLVQPFNKPIEVEAVDDTMLLYSTESFQQGSEEYWEVPTAGGASVFGAAVSLGDVKPLLHDHTIYFVDSSNAPTNTIWALSETPNSTAKKVVTTSTPIFAIATDSCGIVYTTTDDTVQNGIVTRVAF